MLKYTALALFPILFFLLGFQTDDSKDHKAVERACLDYVEAFYDVKPELLEGSLHKDLQKFGFYREGKGGDYKRTPATYDSLVKFAGTMNEGGWVPKDAPKKITVYEVLDKVAAARIEAFWGIDYVHLSKEKDGWKIVQVVWQSHPE